MADTNELLQQLLTISNDMAGLMAADDPNPDHVTELLEKRSSLFHTLQETGINSKDVTPEQQELARQIVQVDRENIERAESFLNRLRSELDQVKLQQRSVTAYGWVDPRHAPRGGFIDTTLD